MYKSDRVALAFVIVSLASMLGAPAAQADDPSAPRCDRRTVPVHVGLASLTISGTYCRPAAGAPDSAFVLVPGATYSHEYWDFQYEPDTYSFSRGLARNGYASFAIDRLGTGQSSKPLSVTVTSFVQASAVHQVIGLLRGSGFDGDHFSRVLLAGHSLGSGIAIIEAATYRDVDGLVLTGIAHRFNLQRAARLVAVETYPAPLDPAFAGTTIDPGYLTTRPGLRKAAFHDPGQVDPAVIQRDEATKDAFSVTEAPDGFAFGMILPYSHRITAPVIIVDGSEDSIACVGAADCSSSAALRAQEQPYYAKSPCLSALVMPNVGHDLNLHPTAPVTQDRVASWANAIAGGDCPG